MILKAVNSIIVLHLDSLGKVCVPLFANWHMIITRAWLATFRDYHVVADNSFDHKIVMLLPGWRFRV